MSTINKEEIQKFSNLADEWWDVKGKFKPLHMFNPIRLEYITEKISNQDKKYAHLSMKGGGCAGFEYSWTFTDSTDDGVLIEDTIVVDKIAEMYIYGSEIDYVEQFAGSQLVINNPNATAACGCGESFGV